MVSGHSRLKIASGFTLIEMLISLGIFGVITGMVMANFRVGSQGDELRASSLLVAGVIRRAQTAALTGETARFCRDESGNDGQVCSSDDICGAGTCVSDAPRGGYGVHFETSETGKRLMIGFVDTNGNGVYDVTERVRSDNISANIYVNVIGLAPAVDSALDILFVPPRPQVKFNNTTSEPIATITLQHRYTNQTKIVTVNSISGQISAD
jgi:prepilin-type N-terminal cleavage/methylation domain-containing protein